MPRLLLGLLVFTLAGSVVIAQNRLRFATRAESQAPVNLPPAISVLSYSAGVSTTSTEASGIAGDDLNILDSVTCSVNTGASCTVIGTFTWTATIGASVELSSGANVVTFTADDGVTTPTTTQITITFTAPDPEAPEIFITSPNDGEDYQTSNANANLAGNATDNVAVVETQCKITTDATWRDGSGQQVDEDIPWTNNVPIPIGVSVIECRAIDEQDNLSPVKTITVTRVADTEAPTLDITGISSNGSSVMDGGTITANDLDIAFTATDAEGVLEVRCTNEFAATEALARKAPRAFNGASANPPMPTSINGALNNRRPAIGEVTYTCWAWDAAFLHSATDSFTVTYVPSSVIIIAPPGMPPARTGTAYQWDLRADGGDGVYTWDNGSGAGTLAGAACDGLSIADVAAATAGTPTDVGRVSGTPTTEGTCTVTFRACDSAARCASSSRALTVGSAALVNPFAHLTTLAGLGGGGVTVKFAKTLEAQADLNGMAADGVATYATGVSGQGGRLVYDAATNVNLQEMLRVRSLGLTGTRTVHVLYQMKWDYAVRSNGCYGGTINAFIEPSLAHKEVQNAWTHDGGDLVNGDFGVEHLTAFDASTTNCALLGGFNIRVYNNQQNPNPTGVTSGLPPLPCGIVGCTPAGPTSFVLYPDTWYLIAAEFRMGADESDFTDWNAFIPTTLTEGSGYHMASVAIWSEWEATPRHVLFRYPVDKVGKVGTAPITTFASWWMESNTSSPPGSMSGNFELLFRNLAILDGYAPAGNWIEDTNLFVRPTR